MTDLDELFQKRKSEFIAAEIKGVQDRLAKNFSPELIEALNLSFDAFNDPVFGMICGAVFSFRGCEFVLFFTPSKTLSSDQLFLPFCVKRSEFEPGSWRYIKGLYPKDCALIAVIETLASDKHRGDEFKEKMDCGITELEVDNGHL